MCFWQDFCVMVRVMTIRVSYVNLTKKKRVYWAFPVHCD